MYPSELQSEVCVIQVLFAFLVAQEHGRKEEALANVVVSHLSHCSLT